MRALRWRFFYFLPPKELDPCLKYAGTRAGGGRQRAEDGENPPNGVAGKRRETSKVN